jgi:archaellum component FlaC
MKKEDEILKVLNVLVIRIDGVEKSVCNLEKTFGERFDRIEERLGVIEERLDVIEERLNVIEERFDTLELRFNDLEKQFIELKESVNKLEDRFVFKIDSLEYIVNGYFQKVSKDHANLHIFVNKSFSEVESRLLCLEETKV